MMRTLAFTPGLVACLVLLASSVQPTAQAQFDTEKDARAGSGASAKPLTLTTCSWTLFAFNYGVQTVVDVPGHFVVLGIGVF